MPDISPQQKLEAVELLAASLGESLLVRPVVVGDTVAGADSCFHGYSGITYSQKMGYSRVMLSAPLMLVLAWCLLPSPSIRITVMGD